MKPRGLMLLGISVPVILRRLLAAEHRQPIGRGEGPSPGRSNANFHVPRPAILPSDRLRAEIVVDAVHWIRKETFKVAAVVTLVHLQMRSLQRRD